MEGIGWGRGEVAGGERTPRRRCSKTQMRAPRAMPPRMVADLAKAGPSLHEDAARLYVSSANTLLLAAHMLEAFALMAHPAKWADGVDRETHPGAVGA